MRRLRPGGPGLLRGPRGPRAQSLTAACVPGLPTVVKLVDRETLMKEREEKKKVRNHQPGGEDLKHREDLSSAF